jgi:prolyl oligopeptidase
MHKTNYPSSKREDIVDHIHGQDVPDPYRWLEDIDSEETRAWIKAQNHLTNASLGQISSREFVSRRMAELWDYEKYGVPFEKEGRVFYTRTDGLQNQGVLYWIQDGREQVLLDPNTLSEDGTIALTGHSVSDDGSLLAYGLSDSGSDWQDWYVRRVVDGQDLEDHLKWVKFTNASWTKDGLGFFYSRYDEPEEGMIYKEANFYHKLYYHRIGIPQTEDALIYERPDQKEWGFSGDVSQDGRYLVISVWKGTHRENGVFYKDLEAGGDVVELLGDFDAGYVYVSNDGQVFYFLTDLDAPLSRVIAIDLSKPEREHWLEVISESGDALQSISLVADHFLAVYLHDAFNLVKVLDRSGKMLNEVALPGLGTVLGFQGKQQDRRVYYLFTGFTIPGSLYKYEVLENQSEIFRQPHLKFNPEDYLTRQVFYPSKDGTKIPMFIIHRQDVLPDESTPTYLYGYGGFNIPVTPGFSVPNLVWMEMGGVFALANLRGGGEYGKSWHEAGSKLKKQNVFDDFISAAEWLVENKYTSPGRLAIGGRSNGGLLTGACLTQRPDLFGAVLVIVGVLDMLRFHKFTIGWAWTSDYGSPDDPEEFKALLAYCPYHNVRQGTDYPPTLVATGDHDDRVFPAHSYKFAAALQGAQAGNAPVLIRIDTKAGHGVGKPTAFLIEESADLLAFMAHHLGLKQPEKVTF